MEIVTKEYNVYDFSELSEDAKEKAKQWYLDDDFRPSEFTEIYEQDLQNIFPDSELKLQYSLRYCQGDGLNIYGNLDVNNILNLPTSGFCGNEFETTEIKEDDLGLHCICEECGASFDVNIDEIVEGK